MGQIHVTQTLKNALIQNRLGHGYLFTGSRGVGKTSVARILSRSVNCQQEIKDTNPCNKCSLCIDILQGNNFDVIELDGASNRGIDEIRDLRESIKYPPTSGKYIFNGKEVPANNVEKMTSFRRENVGYIFQFFNLLEDLTAIENILLVQELTGSRDVSRAKELLTMVGLDGLEDRFPYELSGGQQQRVAIARSLAKKPKVLLADEPTGNLDGKTTEQVMQALSDICQKENITAILVTHDDNLLRYASRVIRIDSGKLVSDESIAED